MGGGDKKKNKDPLEELWDASFNMKMQAKMMTGEAAKA